MIRSFNTALTRNPIFRRRSVEAKLLYFLLHHNPDNHFTGLVRLSVEHLAVDMGVNPAVARSALAELADPKVKLVHADEQRDLIWLPEMVKMLGPKISGAQTLAAKKFLGNFEPCALIAKVADAMGCPEACPKGDPPPDPPTQGLPDPPWDPVLGLGQDQDRTGSEFSFAGDASHPPPSPRVVAPDLRHEAGERMTPPARIQEAPTAAQGSLLPAEDAPTAKPARRPKSPKALSTTAIAWQAYAEAYEARYKTAPEKNGQVMGQLARLVANVGGKAPDLCRYYLTRTDARYRYHPVGMMLSDYQGLLTAMTTGRVITETTARERERAASSPMWQYVADQMDKDRGDVVDVESKPE